MAVGNLSPLYQQRNHRIAILRRRYRACQIDEASFRAGLYGLGYAPGEVQLEVNENRPEPRPVKPDLPAHIRKAAGLDD